VREQPDLEPICARSISSDDRERFIVNKVWNNACSKGLCPTKQESSMQSRSVTTLVLLGLGLPAYADNDDDFTLEVLEAVEDGGIGYAIDGHYRVVMIPLDPEQNIADRIHSRTLFVPEDVVEGYLGDFFEPPEMGGPLTLSELLAGSAPSDGCALLDPTSVENITQEVLDSRGKMLDYWRSPSDGPADTSLIDDLSGYTGMFGKSGLVSDRPSDPDSGSFPKKQGQENGEVKKSVPWFEIGIAIIKGGVDIVLGSHTVNIPLNTTYERTQTPGSSARPGDEITFNPEFQKGLWELVTDGDSRIEADNLLGLNLGLLDCPEGDASCHPPMATSTKWPVDPDVNPSGDWVDHDLAEAFKEVILKNGPSWTDPAREDDIADGPVVLALSLIHI